MNARVSLKIPESGYFDEVYVEDIENENCFSYSDNEKSACEVCIFEDGLCFFKQSEDHLLELHLKTDYYAKITTEEGILKIPVKVLDFSMNSDILVIRYLIDDEERIIEIKFYRE